jgi:hypothetical protein
MSVLLNNVRSPPKPRHVRLTICALGIVAAFSVELSAAAQSYDPDISKWQEVPVPPESRAADRAIFFNAANNNASIEWQIRKDGDKILARLTENPVAQSSPRPNFVPKAEHFSGGFAVQRVEDGWLVGFNDGEFGAALYWFSKDGRQKYKISDDQVVDFMRTPQGIIAIQGLAHLTLSEGSVIRVDRSSDAGRWRSVTIKKLPQAPEAFLRLSNSALIIVLSDSLVSLADDNLTTLIKSSDWGVLYPNSVVANADESKIYVGMRQFVAEFDLRTHKLRYLIPDLKFVRRLPKKTEEGIRREYSQ